MIRFWPDLCNSSHMAIQGHALSFLGEKMSIMSLHAPSTARATRFATVRDNVLKLVMPSRSYAAEEGGVEQMRAMLGEAAQVIRAQEERIQRLEELAHTDELTGIVNRRGLMLALRRELGAARRDRKGGGMLVLIDLDGFKQINDRWGHGVGDGYLQCTAGVLAKELRSTDIVARLGGDEFAVILTRIAPEAAHARLTALEKAFNSRVMHEQGHSIPLRASFGCACYGAADAIENLMAQADTRLYAHKAQKRDAVKS